MNISLGPFSCPFSPWRPAEGRVFDFFAYDTETTSIDHDRPWLTPTYVLGAACDGRRGVFLTREAVRPFFKAHQGVPLICHHAVFDLRVTDFLLGRDPDLYAAVDEGRIWDTLILRRLYALATEGHTARGQAGLAQCARTYLGITLSKSQEDEEGHEVRTGFGRFLGQPPSAIPTEYLTYLAQDTLATWHLFQELHRRIRELLQGSVRVWGYVNDGWLKSAVTRFGPLTHHVQLRACILMDVLTANGIGIDAQRRDDKVRLLEAVLEDCRERLRRRGYLPGEPGNAKALQSILAEFRRDHPGVDLHRTPSGNGWSTAQEDLAELVREDNYFADLLGYRAAEKLLSTYLTKMSRPRLHARFGYLLATGRTYCGGGFNLQNLPKEKLERDVSATVRGCFVPGPGRVFIDADYSQIELVVLGHVLGHQFGLKSELARLVNSGEDVHRLIAAAVLSKPASQVIKAERDSAKPVSFGRPGGMGARRLQQVAKAGYGIELSLEEVQERIQAYHRLCPELDQFLRDEVDVGQVLAERLHLTPAAYRQAIGRYYDRTDVKNNQPAGWLGGMLLKVLGEERPATRAGRLYTAAERDFFWEVARKLTTQVGKEANWALAAGQPGAELRSAVSDWAGRRPVFTITGRLRANATFCSARNCVFQGPAADGAILGLWRVWRAGHQIVDFIHDQVVVESPADATVKDRVAEIEQLMKQGMAEIVPGMRVQMETVVTASLNKKDLDPRYDPETKEQIRDQIRIAG